MTLTVQVSEHPLPGSPVCRINLQQDKIAEFSGGNKQRYGLDFGAYLDVGIGRHVNPAFPGGKGFRYRPAYGAALTVYRSGRQPSPRWAWWDSMSLPAAIIAEVLQVLAQKSLSPFIGRVNPDVRKNRQHRRFQAVQKIQHGLTRIGQNPGRTGVADAVGNLPIICGSGVDCQFFVAPGADSLHNRK